MSAQMAAAVSANECGQHFGLSENTVRRWIRSGRLRADKHGCVDREVLSEVAAAIGPDTVRARLR
jgi:hypothetical protein